MQRIRLSSLLLAAALCSCVNYPNEYAPERARRPDVGPDARRLDAFLDVKNGAAAKHFSGGIDVAAFDGVQRKAGPRASLRFAADAGAAWKFTLEYNSAVEQTIVVRVNGSKLGEFAANGAGTLQVDVPTGTLVAGTAAMVDIESSAGFGLLKAGFARR